MADTRNYNYKVDLGLIDDAAYVWSVGSVVLNIIYAIIILMFLMFSVYVVISTPSTPKNPAVVGSGTAVR